MKNTILAVMFAVILFPLTAHSAFPGYPVVPDPADFGDVRVGQSSAAQTLTMTNRYAVPVTVQQVAVQDTTNFSISNNQCNGTTIPVLGTCSFDVTFNPQTSGHFVSTTELQTYGPLTPGLSTVEGNGVEPVVVLLPASVDFGDQTVGKSSASRFVFLDNRGTADLTITSITADPPFSITSDNCSSPLPAHRACAFWVDFTPTAAGPASGNATVVDDASDSPQTVSLTGTGVTTPQPHASLSQTEIDFGGQLVGTTSQVESVTLKNTGTAVLNIASIAVSGDFGVTDDCGATLAVDASCTIGGTFSPTAAGAATGEITITDDSSHSPQTVTLTGTGVVHEGPKASLSTTSIDFGQVSNGSSSDPQDYTIENAGDEDMVVSDIEITGDDAANFTKESDCQKTIRPGESCTGSITFHPNDQKTFSATVQFTDNTPDSPQTIALTGIGIAEIISGTGCSVAGTAGGLALAPLGFLLAGLAIARRKRRWGAGRDQ
jgi:hypothetical protein